MNSRVVPGRSRSARQSSMISSRLAWRDGTGEQRLIHALVHGLDEWIEDDVEEVRQRIEVGIDPDPGPGDGGTDLVYLSHSELGDSGPAWLVNRMMNDQIINEMLTLQSIIADDLPAVAASPDAAR